jgi:hypothetical protein
MYANEVVDLFGNTAIDLEPRDDLLRDVEIAVQYDERTGIAYTRPIQHCGGDTITTEEIDALGLGPDGGAHCAACGDVAEYVGHWGVPEGKALCENCYHVRPTYVVSGDIARRRAR